MPKLVKDESYLAMINEMIDEDLAVLDEVIEEDGDLLNVVANPETLIGLPYEKWDANIKQRLLQIYGTDSEVLNRFAFKKELASLRELEKQNGGL